MKKYIFPTLLLTILACGRKQSVTNDAGPVSDSNRVTLSEAEIRTAGIKIGRPEKSPVSAFIRVSGIIDVPPQNMVSISFPLGGYVTATSLLPGMKIHKGQVLAELQDPVLIQLQQDYLISKAKSAFLTKEYERQKSLNLTKSTSDKSFEQTESDFRAERILCNSLEQKLRLANINPIGLNETNITRSTYLLSPINGYVASVNVNRGKYVTPSDVLFELINPDDLHLVLTVFEKDLRFIAVDQKVLVSLVNDPSKTYQAQVALISQHLDSDRSAQVHCHFTAGTSGLRPGMFTTAQIEIKNGDGLLVPEDAVVRWQDENYVFLRKANGQFERVPVNCGSPVDGKVEIKSASGNPIKDSLIIENAYAALMKMENKSE